MPDSLLVLSFASGAAWGDWLADQHAMKPAGLQEAELARADGRWDSACASPSRAGVPGDLARALAAGAEASAVFAAAGFAEPLRDPLPDR